MVDLPKFQLDVNFTKKHKCVEDIAAKQMKRAQPSTNTGKAKAKSSTFEKWLSCSKGYAGVNLVPLSGVAISSAAERILPAEVSLVAPADTEQINVLRIDNNVNVCLENTEVASFENIEDEPHRIESDSQFEVSQKSEIWRPQFGISPNLLTTSSSPFTVVSNSMVLARGITTATDQAHMNEKSVTIRHKEMIANIMKVVMLGISLEDALEIIGQMEFDLKAMEELIETLKSEMASMEEKYNFSENSLTTLLDQTRDELKHQKNRADSADASINSQKCLYEQALEKISYIESENAILMEKASSGDITLKAKEKAVEAMSNKVPQQMFLTDAIKEKIRELNSKLKSEIEDAVNIAVNNAVREYTKEINIRMHEYWQYDYDTALVDNSVKVPENENGDGNPTTLECANIRSSPSHLVVVDLDDEDNSNQVSSEVQLQCGDDKISSNDNSCFGVCSDVGFSIFH